MEHMKLFKYESYKQYIKSQKNLTAKKIEKIVWVSEDIIKTICNHFDNNISSVLCHGTRSGDEQKLFRKILGEDAHVVGSELFDGADKFPMTVIHDFNEPREEWTGAFDLVYSNSLDHSFDPEKTLTTWAEQVKPTGRLVVEWHPRSSIGGNVSSGDPFTATNKELINILDSIGMQFDGALLENQTKHRGSLLIFKHK